jgi:glycosyltransferase involved in cell wall biosynthesis
MRISITIIGHNEEYHLRELLPKIAWADEIVYVDCESKDSSLALAKEYGCRTFSRPNNPNLNVNKSFAIEQATGDWIFYLDPDERISNSLRDEILSLIHAAPEEVAFQLGRRNHYFGKWLRHGSRYPDTQLRLFKRGFARFPNDHVHEKLIVNGGIGKLENDMLHYPFLTVSQFFVKFDFYTTFEANYLYQKGVRVRGLNHLRYLFALPLSRFVRRYLFKLGFLDGLAGLFACLFDGIKFVVTYVKLAEICRETNLTSG